MNMEKKKKKKKKIIQNLTQQIQFERCLYICKYAKCVEILKDQSLIVARSYHEKGTRKTLGDDACNKALPEEIYGFSAHRL